MKKNFLNTYCQYEHDKEQFEETLYGICKFEYTKMWCDSYDASIEFAGLLPEIRLNEEACKFFKDAGFEKVYLNHIDLWETHYSLPSSEGWRVSYPHKNGAKGLLVEKMPQSWKGIHSAIVVEPPVYEKKDV